MKTMLIILLSTAVMFSAWSEGNGHNHGAMAKHGGKVYVVGEHAAHIEVVHIAKYGLLNVYVLDATGKKELGISNAIKLDFFSKDQKKMQLVTLAYNLTEGKSSHFVVQNENLKTHAVVGRLSFKIKDKKYSVRLTHDHGRDH